VETHLQRECWSLHFYHYAGSLRAEGMVYSFLPGSASLLPPACEVEWRFPPHASHYYVHFKNPAKAKGVSVPVLRPPDAIPPGFGNQFDELIRFFSGGENQRASIRLWDLLFQIVEPISPRQPVEHLHPSLQTALAVIRNSPGQKLTVQRLAGGMGISRNQLTHLFQKVFHCGAKEYLRQAQTNRALDLLENSVLGIKSIALSCGFSDLSHFNKTIRSRTGLCPTRFRQRGRKAGKFGDLNVGRGEFRSRGDCRLPDARVRG